MSSGKTSVIWSNTQSSRLNPDISSRIAASVSPKTLAQAVPTSGFVLDDKNWFTRLSSASQESTLVSLMSLRTDTAPVLPKLDRRRALFVLTKIDEILAWEERKET